MDIIQSHWQVLPLISLPSSFIDCVNQYCPNSQGNYAAQLLWQRGIQNREQLQGYLDRNYYQP